MFTQKKRSKKRILISLAAIVVLAIAGIITFALLNRPEQATNTPSPLVSVEPSGIVYPTEWKEASEITLIERQNGVISEATRENLSVTAIVREVPGTLPANFDINALPDQVIESLKAEIEGFALISKAVQKVGSFNAVRLDYTTPVNDNDKYHDLMIIVPTAKKTFYLTYQSLNDISVIGDDITDINKSLGQYVKTHLGE
jgi:hypothetical protein